MAKASNRNVPQLLKNNKYSNLPTICSRKGCENEAIVIKGPTQKRKRICAPHYENLHRCADIKTQKILEDIDFFKSLGIL